MKAEIKRNFQAILINPELPPKLLTDTLRTIRYSYRQTDPDVIELVSLAASMGIAEPDKTNAGGAGLASYEYCPGPLTDPCGHQLNPALANSD